MPDIHGFNESSFYGSEFNNSIPIMNNRGITPKGIQLFGSININNEEIDSLENFLLQQIPSSGQRLLSINSINSISKKEKSFKQKIKKYCELLYKYLKSTGTCFIKGAFVIDDEDGKLKELLREGNKGSIINYQIPDISILEKLVETYKSDDEVAKILKKITKEIKTKKDELVKLPQLLSSHKDFGPKPNEVCNSGSGICEINLTDADDVFDLYCDDKYGHDDEYLKDKYESVRQLKKNIKFYFFNNNKSTVGGKNDRFVFFKLELDPTKSFAHLLLALKRYKLGVVENDQLLIRREDCRKDKKGCLCSKDKGNCKFKFEKDPEWVKMNKKPDESCIKNYDQHTRVGDEFFVNKDVNNQIVDIIQGKYTSEFNPDICIVDKTKGNGNNVSTTALSNRVNENNDSDMYFNNQSAPIGSREIRVGGSRKTKKMKKMKKNKRKHKTRKNRI